MDNVKINYNSQDMRCKRLFGAVETGEIIKLSNGLWKTEVPKWYKEGVIYQISIDRFVNGNEYFKELCKVSKEKGMVNRSSRVKIIKGLMLNTIDLLGINKMYIELGAVNELIFEAYDMKSLKSI